MQIDAKIEYTKFHRIVGPFCCSEMQHLLRSTSFDSKTGVIRVGANFGQFGIKYLEIRYCPFCGEEITYSETY